MINTVVVEYLLMIDCKKLVILPHAKFIDVIANATDNKQEGIVKFLISIKTKTYSIRIGFGFL